MGYRCPDRPAVPTESHTRDGYVLREDGQPLPLRLAPDAVCQPADALRGPLRRLLPQLPLLPLQLPLPGTLRPGTLSPVPQFPSLPPRYPQAHQELGASPAPTHPCCRWPTSRRWNTAPWMLGREAQLWSCSWTSTASRWGQSCGTHQPHNPVPTEPLCLSQVLGLPQDSSGEEEEDGEA